MINLTEKRLKELYNRAYERGYNAFSDFLNMDEQSTLASINLPCITYGGYEMAERVVAGFGDYLDINSFPISIICVKPINSKFADKLTHRDYLGALMNLGIKRELLGDIVIKDSLAYVFCLEQISDYICDNLTRIKHTTVMTQVVESLPEAFNKAPEAGEYIISSLRIDVVVSAVFKLSRSEASALFDREKIFVNSRLCVSPSYSVKENDIISVRGLGRIKFLSVIKKTKKDRLLSEIIKYE